MRELLRSRVFLFSFLRKRCVLFQITGLSQLGPGRLFRILITRLIPQRTDLATIIHSQQRDGT